MKKFILFISLFIIGIISLFIINIICCSKNSISENRINDAYKYCIKNNYSTDYCIFVDFSKPSGKHRFYIYCFSAKIIMFSDLCAQGIGNGFSNKPGSYCSSLGKYKIGKLRKMSHYPNEGYSLYGLESTNSNALTRGILIHGGNIHFEVYPFPCLPISQGCFGISNYGMYEIQQIMEYTKKPILLWAYKS